LVGLFVWLVLWREMDSCGWAWPLLLGFFLGRRIQLTLLLDFTTVCWELVLMWWLDYS